MSDAVERYVQLLCHDMNNPLTILLGQADLMSQVTEGVTDAGAQTRLRAAIARIEEQSTRVIDLVAEMREAFRRADGEDAETVDLSEMMRGAAHFVERMRRYRSGELVIEARFEGAKVKTRPFETRGAFWRLIGHAVERSPRVRVWVEDAGPSWRAVCATSGGDLPFSETLPPSIGQVFRRNGWAMEPWTGGGAGGVAFVTAKVL